MSESQECLWRATSTQAQFLQASETFVLFGGAAGGGKSDAGIVDGLGLNNPGEGKRAIDFPHYQGLFLRRSMPELLEIIHRTHELYPQVGWDIGPDGTRRFPVWREQKKMWVFPSGAKILFGYVKDRGDERRYQGWEYQWIMWEELTQWPDDHAFQFLNSRLRKKADMPVRPGIRATCNPGGVGHQWVRDFWQISADGSPNLFTVPMKIDLGDGPVEKYVSRRFIPSRLEDNPHVDQESYATQLEGLSAQMKNALRHGRWDIVDIRGMIFMHQIGILHTKGHFRPVPHDDRYPVLTWWDFGVRDKIAIWYYQKQDGNDCFIDYDEFESVGLAIISKVLTDKPYQYAAHCLPHDVMKRQHRIDGTIAPVLDIVEDLGIKPVEVVPRTSDISQGIEAARAILPKCFFDTTACDVGIKALSNYRYAQDKNGVLTARPIHDQYSHGADAFRQFAQGYGLIDDILADHRVGSSDPLDNASEADDDAWVQELRKRKKTKKWRV